MFLNDVASSLREVTIPSSITSIGQSFRVMQLYLFIVNSSLIGGFAFAFASSFTQVYLVNGLTVISDSMFVNPVHSSLGSIVIPSTVISIGTSNHRDNIVIFANSCLLT